MKKFILFVICLSLMSCAVKKNTSDNVYHNIQTVNDICHQVQCQYQLKVTLKNKDGSIFDKTYDFMPIVQPTGVFVLAGHSVNFEADIDNNQLTNFKLVNEIKHPEKTITAKLMQLDDGSMMLRIKNPFDKILKFNMGIMPLDKEELYPTSSCPVIAHGGSYEMWPYPIFQVWLGGAQLMDKKDKMTCN